MNEEQKKLKQMREEAKGQRAQVAKLVKVIHKGIDQSQFQVPQGPVNHNGLPVGVVAVVYLCSSLKLHT